MSLPMNIARLLQDDQESDDFGQRLSSFIRRRYGTFVGIVIAAMIVLVVFYCVIREYCQRRWGRNCCEGSLDRRRRIAQERRQQQLEDERMATQLQQELQDEDKELALQRIRQERRAKYEEFLKPYTMLVKADDICRSATPREIEGFTDEETGKNTAQKTDTFLKFPPRGENGTQLIVEASCAVCLLDYDVGDEVVCSTRSVCPHAFHRDCILMWLEKGKKRCPICRNFFVPGAAVDDKKVISHADDDEFAIDASGFLQQNRDDESEIRARARSDTLATDPLSVHQRSDNDFDIEANEANNGNDAGIV